jgi:MFS family permease
MTSTMTIEAIELQPLPIASSPNPSGPEDTLRPSNRLSDEAINIPEVSTTETQPLSNLRLTLTILQPSLVNFFGSFTSGIITVGLPIIANNIALPRSLYLWPSSVYSLTSGACLLLASSVADIIGARRVEVCGMFILGTCILACGFAQTGIQLVVFRAFQGIALAMHIPASVALVANAVPEGRKRNVGFSCLGLSQPLGFSCGIVLSGVMIERIGWRSGFYMCGAGILTNAIVSSFTLPKIKNEAEGLNLKELGKKLWKEVDWVGGGIAGSALALLSYVFA